MPKIVAQLEWVLTQTSGPTTAVCVYKLARSHLYACTLQKNFSLRAQQSLLTCSWSLDVFAQMHAAFDCAHSCLGLYVCSHVHSGLCLFTRTRPMSACTPSLMVYTLHESRLFCFSLCLFHFRDSRLLRIKSQQSKEDKRCQRKRRITS